VLAVTSSKRLTMFFKLFRRNNNASKQNTISSLEDDKQRLISALENQGIRYLVKEMANDNIYSDLLVEKRKSSISSDDSISWYAYRQSEKLSSPNDKKELLDLLSKDDFHDYKKYIYCCLSNICANTNDRDLFNFLIGKVEEEDDDSIKVSILSRLEAVKKDAAYKIDPIKKLVAEGTYDVSHAAIKALSYSSDPEVENLLLDEFKITDKHMKGMICGPLGTVGTSKSIPILKEAYKKTRDQFLRMAIERALQEIEARGKATPNNALSK
jgi:hypothetical protein